MKKLFSIFGGVFLLISFSNNVFAQTEQSCQVTTVNYYSSVSTHLVTERYFNNYTSIDPTSYTYNNFATELTPHPAWTTALGPSAKWISYASQVETTGDELVLFKQPLNIPAGATNVQIHYRFSSDNAAELFINNTQVDSLGDVFAAVPASLDAYFSQVKENTYSPSSIPTDVYFVLRNWGGSWTVEQNPTGLAYALSVSYTMDSDDDGICDEEDHLICNTPENDVSSPTSFSGGFGVNRWHLEENAWKQTYNPKAKNTPNKAYDLDYTYGCGCKQILDKLNEAGLGEFGGHYKFGCSTSILEDFHANASDGNLGGRYFIESVTVPANRISETSSTNSLASGVDYILKASGSWTNSNNLADAEYVTKDNWVTQYDGYNFDPYYLGANSFDLQVNRTFIDWGTYNTAHTYTMNFTGTGTPIKFLIFDGDSANPTLLEPGWYSDNSGAITVDIYAQL